MALVTSKELVQKAQKEGYCVPAINTQAGNYDIIRAICEAAEEARSPVILAQYAKNVHYYGMEWFSEVSKYFANKVSIPVAIHLDHGQTFEEVMKALRYGYTSVMIDCSTETIPKNIEITSEVIRAAHALGVSVEAEVGELGKLGQESKNLANVKDVKEFLTDCQPDLLAIGIGNAHGFYKGVPNIRLDILRDIRAVTDVPLVMHGATGIPDDMVKEAIRIGIAKINFGTLVRHSCVKYYRETIDTLDHGDHIWKVAMAVKDKLKEVVHGIIKLAGSAGTY